MPAGSRAGPGDKLFQLLSNSMQMAAAQQKHLEDVKRRHDEQMKQQSDIEKKRLAASLAAQVGYVLCCIYTVPAVQHCCSFSELRSFLSVIEASY